MSEPVVLRPRRSSFWPPLGGTIFLGYQVVTWGLREDRTWMVVAPLVALSVAVVLSVLATATSRVVLTEDAVTLRRWWRRQVDVPVDDVVGLSAPVADRPAWRSVAPRVVVLRRRSGGPVIRLTEWRWGYRALGRIAHHAGVEHLTWVAAPREVEERAPGTMGRFELLPVKVQVALMLLGAAAVVGVLVAVDHL